MKVSKRTIALLTNFCAINNALKINKGNEIITINEGESVYACAQIDSAFPTDFVITDLRFVLRALKTMEEPEFDFATVGQMIIRDKADQGESQHIIQGGLPRFITYTEKLEVDYSSDITFTLSKDDFSTVTKNAKNLKYEQIEFVGENGELFLMAGAARTSSNERSGGWRRKIMETDHEFLFVFNTESWMMLPEDYEVTLSMSGLAHFKSTGLEYVIAADDEKSYIV
jgi:hypothetical protein